MLIRGVATVVAHSVCWIRCSVHQIWIYLLIKIFLLMNFIRPAGRATSVSILINMFVDIYSLLFFFCYHHYKKLFNLWRIFHDVFRKRHGFVVMGTKPKNRDVFQFRHCPAQNTVTLKKIRHEQQTRSLKPNFNILLSFIPLPILPYYAYVIG